MQSRHQLSYSTSFWGSFFDCCKGFKCFRYSWTDFLLIHGVTFRLPLPRLFFCAWIIHCMTKILYSSRLPSMYVRLDHCSPPWGWRESFFIFFVQMDAVFSYGFCSALWQVLWSKSNHEKASIILTAFELGTCAQWHSGIQIYIYIYI